MEIEFELIHCSSFRDLLDTVMQLSDDLVLVFKHKLCSYPPALFDSSMKQTSQHLLMQYGICENGVPADIPDYDI